MKTFQYIMEKFGLDESTESPAKLGFKRGDLGNLFGELGFKTGAEIGVYQGHHSEDLCLRNPGVKLHCVDPWEIYESEEEEFFSQNQEALSGFYEDTKKRLAPYDCNIIRKTSMEAVKDFEPGSLDFIYLDANHDFKHITEDLDAWAEIVRRDGIVSGHDYGHWKHKDKGLAAKRAIDDYVKKHNIKMLFLFNKNNQTTWFFIKQGGEQIR